MEQQRQFRGVWVPKELIYNKELTQQEKTFLVEMDSLEDEDKGCWASNKHFTDMFGVSSSNVSRTMKSLKNKGYIRINYVREGKEIIERHIFINRPPYPETGYYQNDNGGAIKMTTGVLSKPKEGYYQNCKESNTYLNNTYLSNTKENIYKDIVEYLNLKTNAKYKYTTNKTKELIKARINEGFTVEDFKIVIDKMTREWIKDNKMKNYLRPETLFGTKFEGYLNRPERELTTKDLEEYINVEEAFL